MRQLLPARRLVRLFATSARGQALPFLAVGLLGEVAGLGRRDILEDRDSPMSFAAIAVALLLACV
jgi:hypothetical protein